MLVEYPIFVGALEPEAKAAYVLLFDKYSRVACPGHADDETDDEIEESDLESLRDLSCADLANAVQECVISRLKEGIARAAARRDFEAQTKYLKELTQAATAIVVLKKVKQRDLPRTEVHVKGALPHAFATRENSKSSSLMALSESGKCYFIPLRELGDEEGYAIGFMGSRMKLDGLVGLDHIYALLTHRGDELNADEVTDPTYHNIFSKSDGTDKQKQSDERGFLDVTGELPFDKEGGAQTEFSMQSQFSMQFRVDRKGRAAATSAIVELEAERAVALRGGNERRVGEIDELLRELRSKKVFKSHGDQVSFETVKRAIVRAVDAIAAKNKAAAEYFRVHIRFDKGVAIWFDDADLEWVISTASADTFPQN